jgi:mannose-6-phosphate isomerase-like protein (cupin superfamily)
MTLKSFVAVGVAVFVFVGGAQAQYYYGGASTPAARAQDAKPEQPKGVKSRGLVGSTGSIASVAMTVPVAMTGQVVEIVPGGQTGTQRNLVPSFIYVLEGTLVINTKGGPIGVDGIQYHGEGQSYAGPANLWYNVMNTGQAPARYVILYVAPPGAKTVEQAKGDE